MADVLQNVAIIGAGLGGCALGLALSEHNIPVTLYESRPEIADHIPSGVLLTPNGLKVLHRLGVWERIREHCYSPRYQHFKNDNDETIKKLLAGQPDEGYGFSRIWRGVLLEKMREMLEERSVRIFYESKFEGVEEETERFVVFRVNARREEATLLIGSDGIYSTVRQYIAPGIVPEYTGLLGVLAHIRRDSVAWPYANYEKNATIQSKPGAIFWVSEDPRGEELMIGKQVKFPEQTRQDLDRLQADKDQLASFYRENYEQYGATARKIIDSVCERKRDIFIWAYMKMPQLARWFSATGRVVLVGDGAHALPPSSGQGINQALEDIYSLSLMLSSFRDLVDGNGTSEERRQAVLIDGLFHWQRMRQARIDAVLGWTNNVTNVARMSEAERQELVEEGKWKEGQGDDRSWLWDAGIEESVDAWVKTYEL